MYTSTPNGRFCENWDGVPKNPSQMGGRELSVCKGIIKKPDTNNKMMRPKIYTIPLKLKLNNDINTKNPMSTYGPMRVKKVKLGESGVL